MYPVAVVLKPGIRDLMQRPHYNQADHRWEHSRRSIVFRREVNLD